MIQSQNKNEKKIRKFFLIILEKCLMSFDLKMQTSFYTFNWWPAFIKREMVKSFYPKPKSTNDGIWNQTVPQVSLISAFSVPFVWPLT